MDGNKKIKWIVFSGVITLAITACKIQPSAYPGLYVDNSTYSDDTIACAEAQLNMLQDTAMAGLSDTGTDNEQVLPLILHPEKETFKISSDSIYQHEVRKLLKDIKDSIQVVHRKIIELQNQYLLNPDTGYAGKSIYTVRPLYNIDPEEDFKQLVEAKNDTIAMLQNQLNALQDAVAGKSQQAQITREPVEAEPLGKQQAELMTQQLIQAKNDTILFLRNELQNLRLQPQERDTVYIEKEHKELQAGKEPVAKQEGTGVQALQDTISLLKTRVLNLEEQILPGMDTTATARQPEKDAPYPAATDTTLLIAFYRLGEIKPLEEESILLQIEELCRNKKVDRITLSGYTDSSGNAKINKEITNRRLNYLSEMIIPWIKKEKIFYQNFGDTFASDMMLINERKIEIRIFTK